MIPIRAFIGIEFESECKRNIRELQQNFRKYAVKGRWKHSDNFHLTLKFLDEISSQQHKQIDEAMKELCMEYSSFRLGIADAGVFMGRDAIRVLWLGLTGDLPQLHSLSAEIDKALEPIGFPPEKRSYTPHITLGQDILFDSSFEEIKEKAGHKGFSPVQVKSIALFKSEQLQNKRIYTKVSEYALMKKA